MLCKPGDSSFSILHFLSTQFSVCVCFGITTNKAQGQSFSSTLGTDLRENVFSQEQLYVVLPMAKSPKRPHVSSPALLLPKNVVYLKVAQN